MDQRALRLYCILALTAVFTISLPKTSVDSFRGCTAAVFGPTWNSLTTLAVATSGGAGKFTDNRIPVNARERLKQLETENLLLTERLKEVQELLLSEAELSTHLSHWAGEAEKSIDNDYILRRKKELARLFDTYTDSLAARVIYRPPVSWNSCLWINVGMEDNLRLQREWIGKGSPVVVGYSLVGVVDYVGKRQSRVRLLSDPAVNPSVRALRGGGQQLEIARHLDALIEGLSSQEQWVTDHKEVLNQIKSLRAGWNAPSRSWYLAKGEMMGAGKSDWRREGQVLKGSGFNYDYADEEGPALDLRHPILKIHDLLVTTGMDGVFPKGLLVGRVTYIKPLKEGDYYYDLEAEPTAGDFDQLSWVRVLPPVAETM